MHEHLRVLVDFHAWQGMRLLDAADLVPTEALTTPLSNGTLFESLRHIVDVNFSWRHAAEGRPDPGLVWEVEPLEDMTMLRAFWAAEDDRLSALLASWSGDDDLERTVVPSWRTEPFKLWQIVMHIVTHQSDAVGEIGWAITRLGQSPGELGFMQYVHTHRPAAGL